MPIGGPDPLLVACAVAISQGAPRCIPPGGLIRRWRSLSSSSVPPPSSSFRRFRLPCTPAHSAASSSMARSLIVSAVGLGVGLAQLLEPGAGSEPDAAARAAVARRAFSRRRALRLLPRRRQSRRRRSEPLCARLRQARACAAARAALLSAVPRRHEPRRRRRRRLHLPLLVGVHVALLLGAGDGA